MQELEDWRFCQPSLRFETQNKKRVLQDPSGRCETAFVMLTSN